MSALLTGLAVGLAAFLAGVYGAGAERRLGRLRYAGALLAVMLVSSPLVLRIVDRLAGKLAVGQDHSGAAFLFVWVLTAGALGWASGALARMRVNDAALTREFALIAAIPPLGLALALPPTRQSARAETDSGAGAAEAT
jgi:uncharacterized membrane protein YhaH (DUF805 family)